MSFFKQSELIELAQEKGDRVEICQQITIPGNPNLGIPDETSLNCKTVIGHIGRGQSVNIPLLGTQDNYPSDSTTLYINNVDNFDPLSVEPTTRFRVNNQVYKVTNMGENIIYQGHILYYVYNIKDTEN
ncbi:hypothetical protein [Crocosphaera sp.]|uniref:hypothetical protein n=1 Tax=Crocosphaera sp. TaxID=2729996 RepID=UPI002636B7DE|nr:hypothetical protein [Crocosphaera sp.]MDJ0579668.1 hypothetical protein [Crocosphaera sp.]